MKDISLNFGAVRDSILRLSSAEIMKESTNKTLSSFLQAVKSSTVLSKQQIIYKNFEGCKPFEKERLAERFINQNISIFNNVRWEDIIRENRDLRLTMLSSTHVEANGGKNTKLFEHISTLIESKTRRGFTAFDKEIESYDFLVNYLTAPKDLNETSVSKEKNDGPDLNSWKFITKRAVNTLNERLEHLNEEEKSIFKILVSDDSTKTNYIEDLKSENLELINEILKETKTTEKDKRDLLEGFKLKLENINGINMINADEYIFSCLELKNTLSEIKK
jgi:hypothetical protein